MSDIKKFLRIIFFPVFYLAVIGSLIFYFREPLGNIFVRLKNIYFPCQQPIAYRINSFDPQFGLSKEQFQKAIYEAEQIWEESVSKDLFGYYPDGYLKINLIYDDRQEATTKLQKLGITITDDKDAFDSLKAKYESAKVDYTKNKTAFEARVAFFESRKTAYETGVESWNKQKRQPERVILAGGSREEYDRLDQERDYLNSEISHINQLQDSLNAEVDKINALTTVLNRLASSLNIKTGQFNTIGKERGDEFEEGTYESGPDGEEINIYQFDDRAKLVRVLAHELGHALGLDHLDDSRAIMYRLNNGINAKLTVDDIAALKEKCGL